MKPCFLISRTGILMPTSKRAEHIGLHVCQNVTFN